MELGKGQLISKCLFGVLNSPNSKNERKQFDLRYHSSKVDFFFSFLLRGLKIAEFGPFKTLHPESLCKSTKRNDEMSSTVIEEFADGVL